MGKERGREVGERGSNPGGTCHNDKPGLDSGKVERWEQGVGEMAGPATMASRACIGRVEENKEGRSEGRRYKEGKRGQRLPKLQAFFFWLVAAWVKSRAERPSVSGVNRQLHVQNRMQIRN